MFIVAKVDYFCELCVIITARCTVVQNAVFRVHVCPSVYPSVTLVDQDHIGWKSWKLIAWTVQLAFALRSPKAIHAHLFPAIGVHGEICGRLWMGWMGK